MRPVITLVNGARLSPEMGTRVKKRSREDQGGAIIGVHRPLGSVVCGLHGVMQSMRRFY